MVALTANVPLVGKMNVFSPKAWLMMLFGVMILGFLWVWAQRSGGWLFGKASGIATMGSAKLGSATDWWDGVG